MEHCYEIIAFLIVSCFSLNSVANDYFNELLKPDSPPEILVNKKLGFAKWSKAAFDYKLEVQASIEWAVKQQSDCKVACELSPNNPKYL